MDHGIRRAVRLHRDAPPQGINFTRMYSEPSCTPSRAAILTGRHAVRNGMYNVAFPYEYGGLDMSEVTTAAVLSKAGFTTTAFCGKGAS